MFGPNEAGQPTGTAAQMCESVPLVTVTPSENKQLSTVTKAGILITNTGIEGWCKDKTKGRSMPQGVPTVVAAKKG